MFKRFKLITVALMATLGLGISWNYAHRHWRGTLDADVDGKPLVVSLKVNGRDVGYTPYTGWLGVGDSIDFIAPENAPPLWNTTLNGLLDATDVGKPAIVAHFSAAGHATDLTLNPATGLPEGMSLAPPEQQQ